MFTRHTSSIAKEDVFPRLLYCDSRYSQTCRQRSQVFPGLSLALPDPLNDDRNALQGSDTLLRLTHLSLHSTSTQALLEASSDYNTFSWCTAKIKVGNSVVRFDNEATRSLGIWMDAYLMFKEHHNRWMTKARAGEARLRAHEGARNHPTVSTSCPDSCNGSHD